MALLEQEAVTPVTLVDTVGEGYGSYRIGLVRQALRVGDPSAIRGLAYLGVQVNDESRVFLAGQGSSSLSALDEAWSNEVNARRGVMGTWGYLVGPYATEITPAERIYVLSRLIEGAAFEPLGFIIAADEAPLPASLPVLLEIEATGRFSITIGRARPNLEALRGQLTAAELHAELGDLVDAICLNAVGPKATVCSQFIDLMEAGPEDVGALADLVSLADSALSAGTLSPFERALVAGNGAVLIGRGGPITVAATADTDLRQGTPNQNQGSANVLSLRASGRHRALVRADLPSVSSSQVASARLEFDIVLNAENWGTSGRTIDAHRLLVAWTEGGATWNCPSDTEPGDPNADCPGSGWAMFTLDPAPYAPTPSGSLLVTGTLTGTVSIDVTADVQAMLAGQVSNHGWIVRKTDEGAAGRIEIASKETGSGPRLVIELANE